MKTNINSNWLFTKDESHVTALRIIEKGEPVDLPHTWNGKDGQDGGNDYYRGKCWYSRILRKDELPGPVSYVEFNGANSSADVYFNGKPIGHHDGGYSTFRCRLPEEVMEENYLLVAVDNSPNDKVYPQMADFTFYGGLYRDVNLWNVPFVHFDLGFYGSPGLIVDPRVDGKDGYILVTPFVQNGRHETITYTLWSGDQVITQEKKWQDEKVVILVPKVHRWDGINDPHLYRLHVELSTGDERTFNLGFRDFSFDPGKGFFLNGRPYPLHGVSFHQDRPGIGNALGKEQVDEDFQIILEMGANAIRLSNYQRDQYVYDKANELGFVVWSEVPYISRNLKEGRENILLQMKELIAQNFFHPCVILWGLSNEIAISGSDDQDTLGTLKELNTLCHDWDRTRPTAMAVVSMCDPKSSYLKVPDNVGWNHFFGWYGGEVSMGGEKLDEFHRDNPFIPVAMSEYGADALDWHSSNPQQGDYTEEYQAWYHEEMIKSLFTKEYLWGTFVWNMFDFGSDVRTEGGEEGINHKGLVSFDRKYRKDSYYAYKAWLSKEPFVHIAGKRYVNRVEDVASVTVYSNQPAVELFAGGVSLGIQTAKDHFFRFQVPNVGETVLLAKAGGVEDTAIIRKVESFDESYRMVETRDMIAWYDIDTPTGRLSVLDNLSMVRKHPLARLHLHVFLRKLMKRSIQEGKSQEADQGKVRAMFHNRDFLLLMGSCTLKRAISLFASYGLPPATKDEVLALNRKLNRIRK